MNYDRKSFISKLMQGSGILLSANLLSKGATILMLPLLTAILSPELYGEAALVATLISLISMIALSGMEHSYARAFFGTNNASSAQVEMLIWRRSFWHGIAGAALAALIWALYSRSQVGLHTELTSLIALGVCGTMFATLAQVRARLLGHYNRMAAGLVIASILSYAVIYLFALRPATAVFALVTGSVVLVWVSGLSQKIPNGRKLLDNTHPADETETKKILAVGLPVIVTGPAFWVVGSADRWFLSANATTAEVGIYAIGVSFGTLGMILNSAVLSVWVPEIVREYESKADKAYKAFGQAKRLLILAYAFMWVAITVLSPDLIRLLVDEQYHNAKVVVPWIAGGVFFYGCAHLFNTVFLLERNMNTVAAIWAAAILLSLASNMWAVPRYGMTGAAAVQCLVFSITATIQWWFSQRIRRIAVFTPRLFLQLLVLFWAGYLGQYWFLENVLLSLGIKLILLGVMTALFLWRVYNWHSARTVSGESS